MRDIHFDKQPLFTTIPSRYSPGAAWIHSLNVSVGLLCTGVLIVLLRTTRGNVFSTRAWRWDIYLGVLAVVFCLLFRAHLTTVRPSSARVQSSQAVTGYLKSALQEARALNPRENLDAFWMQQRIDEILDGTCNLFTGQPIRQEDSPGNYTLHVTPNGFVFAWYDAEGAPHVTNLPIPDVSPDP